MSADHVVIELREHVGSFDAWIALAVGVARGIDPRFTLDPTRADTAIEVVSATRKEQGAHTVLGRGRYTIDVDDRKTATYEEPSWVHRHEARATVGGIDGVELAVRLEWNSARVEVAGSPELIERAVACLTPRGIYLSWLAHAEPPHLPGADDIPALLAALPIDLRPPPSAASLQAAAQALGQPLPQELAALYACCDGGRLRAPEGFEVLSLERAMTLRRRLHSSDRAVVPILGEGDAADFCFAVLTTPPLAGRVVFFGVWSSGALWSPSIATFVSDLCRVTVGVPLADQVGGRLEQAPSWYAEHPRYRTSEDAALGMALASQDVSKKRGYDCAIDLAVVLAGDVPTLERLLHHEPTSRSANERLRALGTPDAKRALRVRGERLRAIADRACARFDARGVACRVVDRDQEGRGPHLAFHIGRDRTYVIEELKLEGASGEALDAWVEGVLALYRPR